MQFMQCVIRIEVILGISFLTLVLMSSNPVEFELFIFIIISYVSPGVISTNLNLQFGFEMSNFNSGSSPEGLNSFLMSSIFDLKNFSNSSATFLGLLICLSLIIL